MKPKQGRWFAVLMLGLLFISKMVILALISDALRVQYGRLICINYVSCLLGENGNWFGICKRYAVLVTVFSNVGFYWLEVNCALTITGINKCLITEFFTEIGNLVYWLQIL